MIYVSDEGCEYVRLRDQRRCGALIKFRVQVGTRKYDAQLTCSQHLARTCAAMAYGESDDGPPVPLTVTQLRVL